MVSYKKLRDGSWGVIGPVTEVVAGPVRVQKRSGETKTETVAKVSRPFGPTDGQLAIGFLSGSGSGRSGGGGRYGRRSCECGDDDCCSPCQCGSECNCRGGNIYNC